ncbi:hypothetical protein [Methanooceanicella nereidis]|nr:hypothetical protein [Methanocella sp. CWC-04]
MRRWQGNGRGVSPRRLGLASITERSECYAGCKPGPDIGAP